MSGRRRPDRDVFRHESCRPDQEDVRSHHRAHGSHPVRCAEHDRRVTRCQMEHVWTGGRSPILLGRLRPHDQDRAACLVGHSFADATKRLECSQSATADDDKIRILRGVHQRAHRVSGNPLKSVEFSQHLAVDSRSASRHDRTHRRAESIGDASCDDCTRPRLPRIRPCRRRRSGGTKENRPRSVPRAPSKGPVAASRSRRCQVAPQQGGRLRGSLPPEGSPIRCRAPPESDWQRHDPRLMRASLNGIPSR